MALAVSRADREQLKRLEENLWREQSRFDYAWLTTVLSEDFFEIGRSGRIHPRREVLSAPARAIGASLPLAEFEVRLLAPDVALVTYLVSYLSGMLRSEGPTVMSRRSSLWSRSEMGWVLRFHQGTPT